VTIVQVRASVRSCSDQRLLNRFGGLAWQTRSPTSAALSTSRTSSRPNWTTAIAFLPLGCSLAGSRRDSRDGPSYVIRQAGKTRPERPQLGMAADNNESEHEVSMIKLGRGVRLPGRVHAELRAGARRLRPRSDVDPHRSCERLACPGGGRLDDAGAEMVARRIEPRGIPHPRRNRPHRGRCEPVRADAGAMRNITALPSDRPVVSGPGERHPACRSTSRAVVGRSTGTCSWQPGQTRASSSASHPTCAAEKGGAHDGFPRSRGSGLSARPLGWRGAVPCRLWASQHGRRDSPSRRPSAQPAQTLRSDGVAVLDAVGAAWTISGRGSKVCRGPCAGWTPALR
jgi:hypothetical protein